MIFEDSHIAPLKLELHQESVDHKYIFVCSFCIVDSIPTYGLRAIIAPFGHG